MDVFNIPYGTTFGAPYKPKYHGDPGIVFDKNQLCFARGVLDTMLWHAVFSHHNLEHVEIYEIEPIGKVSEYRCLTDTGLYQCCAAHIKFLQKQNIYQMYERALSEYNDTFKTKYKNFDIKPDLWKKHEPTVFLVPKSYDCEIYKLRTAYEVKTKEYYAMLDSLSRYI